MFFKETFKNIKDFSDTQIPSFNDIISGVSLTELIYNNIKFIGLIVILIFIYIGNRYSCMLDIIEIDKLETKLNDVKLDALTQTSDLMNRSRQSYIKSAIRKREINITESVTPPYTIKDE